LFEEPSRQIVKNLYGPESKPAAENLLCLNCHVQPGLDALPASGGRSGGTPGVVLADGVGCENCHGPAEKWLKLHYQDDWKRKKPEDKAALGFRETKDLVVRAQVCVGCHVGRENLDVNHRLIAAGHPRLRFEYAAYLTNLPKHWDEKKDRAGHRDFDVQVWAIGQVVSMQAALKLLEHRAATPAKPWPEFAEYDCFSCHHVLADAKWRRDPKRLREQPPGSSPWGSWYYPLGETLAQHPPGAGLKLPAAELKELAQLMQPPYSDAKRSGVARQAGEAAQQLTSWLPGLRQPPAGWEVRGLADAIERRVRTESGPASWDEAAQLYLALAAERPEGPRKELMTALRRSLEFPARYESPRGFDPRRIGDKRNTGRPDR
jgi:hypothetical protein